MPSSGLQRAWIAAMAWGSGSARTPSTRLSDGVITPTHAIDAPARQRAPHALVDVHTDFDEHHAQQKLQGAMGTRRHHKIKFAELVQRGADLDDKREEHMSCKSVVDDVARRDLDERERQEPARHVAPPF